MNGGQLWDACASQNTVPFWTSVYQILEVDSDTIPLPSSIWEPGFSLTLNNVGLSSGWELVNDGVQFDTPPLLGDTVTIDFQLINECQ